MPAQTIITDKFGSMALNPIIKFYETKVVMPNSKLLHVAITATNFEIGVNQANSFLEWVKVNDQAFKLSLEDRIQNADLVWDDIWDSILGKDWVEAEAGFLANYLHYDELRFDGEELHLWVNTSGLHTDHKIRATINEEMRIVCCEML